MADDEGWEEYKAEFKKIYKNAEEEQLRRKLFLKCKRRIDEKNRYYIAHNDCTRISLGAYSDYTPRELSKVNFNACHGFEDRIRKPQGPELPDVLGRY